MSPRGSFLELIGRNGPKVTSPCLTGGISARNFPSVFQLFALVVTILPHSISP